MAPDVWSGFCCLFEASVEASTRERLRRLLDREPDVQILAECADGPEAVCALRQEDADLLFLDVQMPEMDGFEVLSALAPVGQ